MSKGQKEMEEESTGEYEHGISINEAFIVTGHDSTF